MMQNETQNQNIDSKEVKVEEAAVQTEMPQEQNIGVITDPYQGPEAEDALQDALQDGDEDWKPSEPLPPEVAEQAITYDPNMDPDRPPEDDSGLRIDPETGRIDPPNPSSPQPDGEAATGVQEPDPTRADLQQSHVLGTDEGVDGGEHVPHPDDTSIREVPDITHHPEGPQPKVIVDPDSEPTVTDAEPLSFPDDDPIWEEATEVLEDVAEVIEDVGQAAQDGLTEAAYALGDTVGDAVDSYFDAVDDINEAIYDGVGDAAEAIYNGVGDAAEAVGEAFEDAAEAVWDTAGDAADAVGETFEDAGDTIADWLDW